MHDAMLLRCPRVQEMTGLSRSTIYSWISKGMFPAQVQLDPRSVACVAKEVEAWIEARISESRGK